ncbi:MAG: D-alanyl-D-alanine carboxypeptidase [Actinomycetes bacterium]
MVVRRGLAVGLPAVAILLVALPQVAEATSLAQRLDRQFSAAGGAGSALAIELKTGKTIWSRQPDTARIPASVNKLYTTSAALLGLGATRRLETSVLVAKRNEAAARSGELRGNLYLDGQADPTLASSDLTALAKAVHSAGVRRVEGLVLGDEDFLDRIRGVPSHGPGIDPNLGGELGGLTYAHGASAHATVTRFVVELRRAGVTVPKGHVGVGGSPPETALLAKHSSPSIGALIGMINTPSDNFYAETLTKVQGAISLRQGSTAAGLKAAATTLGKLGVHPRRVDGSGIARGNLTTPRTVVRLLSRMAGNSIFTRSLATAGRTGTLADRMRSGAAAGRCRAKTGTLSNVSALAGYCAVAGGGSVAFAMLNNSTEPWKARKRQDAIVQALAAWRRPAG